MKAAIPLFILLLPLAGFAQPTSGTSSPDQPPFNRITQTVDLSLAAKSGFATVALSVNRLHGLGRSHRFRIGYGLRLTSAFGTDNDYRTAPANLTSGSTSLVALFSDDIIANIDTLRLPKTQANSVNLSINLEYALTRRFDVGVNIDGIGVTFGANQRGTFMANAPTRSSLSGTVQEARLTSFNLLLISDSDLGSLNSEAYLRYHLNNRFSLRGGLSFQFNEYTTVRKLTFENDRFRGKNAQPMLAVSYHF